MGDENEVDLAVAIDLDHTEAEEHRGRLRHEIIDYCPAANWGNWAYAAGVGADPRGSWCFGDSS